MREQLDSEFDFSHLNEGQKSAVKYVGGPLMILAGAGSGKTRTLVKKIEYLIKVKGFAPSKILAVTFSNKAAKEMRSRLMDSVFIHERSQQVTTFHALCAHILRTEYSYLGLSRYFTIYDDSESNAIIKNILTRRGISLKEIHPSEVSYFIQRLQNIGFFADCEKYTQYYSKLPKLDDPTMVSLYHEYVSELKLSNAVDFGGLITGVLELFLKHPEVLSRYQSRYKYILIDEYQDTNRSQFILTHLLSGGSSQICIVGDEDQSIYSWRGADINNILDFEKFFEKAHFIKLEQNYRSSKNIIEAATHLIEKNQMRKGKKMWTENPEGEKILIMECKDDREESRFVQEAISDLASQGVPYNDLAVFYRSNAQSRQLEDKLIEGKVPYKIVGGVKFYDRKEIKDILSYLKLIVNPKDSLALSRVINTPARGVGAVSLRKMENLAVLNDLSLYHVIEKLVLGQADSLTGDQFKLSLKMKTALQGFYNLIEDCRSMLSQQEKISVVFEKILNESDYLSVLKKTKSYENMARLENLGELGNAISQFEEEKYDEGAHYVSLEQYLETITLDQSAEYSDGGGIVDQVSLMTVHGAKGLEYEYVFIIGAEDSVFPSFQSLENGGIALEEERRLFYVAMTRAMKSLTITFCKSRLLYGTVRFNDPSRFLFEIPEHYYDWRFSSRDASSANSSQCDDFDQRSHFDDDYYVYDSKERKFTFDKGELVKHKLYGEGQVIENSGQGSNEKVTIMFKSGGVKKFIVQYSPIEKLDPQDQFGESYYGEN